MPLALRRRSRGARIRTGDLADPNGARYQAALHPEADIGYPEWRAGTRSSAFADESSTRCLPRLRADGPPGRRRRGGAQDRCGVSASRELFERAAEAGAQMVIVHHGLFWDNDTRVVGRSCAGACRRSSTPTSRSWPTTWRSTPIRRSGNIALLGAELGIEPERRFTDCSASAATSSRRCPVEPVRRARPGAARPHAARLLLRARAVERVAVWSGAPPVPLAGGRARLRLLRHRRGRRADEACGQGGRRPLRGRGPIRDRDAGPARAGGKLAEGFGLEWEFLDLPNPV